MELKYKTCRGLCYEQKFHEFLTDSAAKQKTYSVNTIPIKNENFWSPKNTHEFSGIFNCDCVFII